MAWLVGLLAACGGGEGPDAPIPCGDNGDCPAGYTCVPVGGAKFCQLGGVLDGGSTIDTCPADAGPAPTTHISQHPDAVTNLTSATFAFTATPSGGTFVCSLDGSPFVACPATADNLTVTVGTHTLRVRAVAAGTCGATDQVGDSFTWVVDQTAPTITNFNCPVPTGNQISITFGSSDASATFLCAVDNGAQAACMSPYQLTNQGIGHHSATVVAKDAAGNTSQPSTCAFDVTGVSPNAHFTNCPGSAILVNTLALDIAADVQGTTFECKSSPTAAFAACTSPFTQSNLADGDYDVFVRGTAGGITDAVPNECKFSVDAVPPTVTLIPPSPDEGGTSGSTAQFKYVSDDPLATFKCSLDGDDPPTAVCDPAGTEYDGLVADSMHIFRIIAIDHNGVASQTLVRHFTVGRGPGVQVTLVPAKGPSGGVIGPNGVVVGPNGNIEFQVMSAATDFTLDCATGGPSFDQTLPGCVSPIPWMSLADDDYTFDVTATNTTTHESSTVHVAFHVDATPPVITFLGPTDITGPQVEVDFTATDRVESLPVTVDCTADGEDFADLSDTGSGCVAGQPNHISLGDGSHDIVITAQDLWGNTAQMPFDRQITVDAVGPNVTDFEGAGTTCPSSSDPDGTARNFFTFTASEQVSAVKCILDGKDITFNTVTQTHCGLTGAESGNFVWDDLGDGNHTLVVVFTDLFGNDGPMNKDQFGVVTSVGFSFKWVVDAEPPTLIFASPPDDDDPSFTNSTINFHLFDNVAAGGTPHDVKILSCQVDNGVEGGTPQDCLDTITPGLDDTTDGQFTLSFFNLKDENIGSGGSPTHTVNVSAEDACGNVNIINMGNGVNKEWVVDSTPQFLAYKEIDYTNSTGAMIVDPITTVPNSGITAGRQGAVVFTVADLHSGSTFNTTHQALVAGTPVCTTDIAGAACTCDAGTLPNPNTDGDALNLVFTCQLNYSIAEGAAGGPGLNTSHQLTISSVDEVGNLSSPTSTTVNWTVDANPPAVSDPALSPSTCTDGTHPVTPASATVTFTSSDAVATAAVSCTLRDLGTDGLGSTVVSSNNCGSPTGAGPFSYTEPFAGLTDNHLYQLTVSVDDHFNPATVKQSVIWRVDTSPPSITFTAPVARGGAGVDLGNTIGLANDTSSARGHFTNGSTEAAGVTFTCNVNSTGPVTCTPCPLAGCGATDGYLLVGSSAASGANIHDGSGNIVLVSGTDCVGNAANGTLNFAVDEEPPSVDPGVADGDIVDSDGNGTISLTMSLSEPSDVSGFSSISCTIDNAGPCTGLPTSDPFGTVSLSQGVTFPHLTPGRHSVQLSTTDFFSHTTSVDVPFQVQFPSEPDIFIGDRAATPVGRVALIGHDYSYARGTLVDDPTGANEVLGNAVFTALAARFHDPATVTRPINVLIWDPTTGATPTEAQNVRDAICDRVAERFQDIAFLDTSIPARDCSCNDDGKDVSNACLVTNSNPITDLETGLVGFDVLVILDQNNTDSDFTVDTEELINFSEAGGIVVALTGIGPITVDDNGASHALPTASYDSVNGIIDVVPDSQIVYAPLPPNATADIVFNSTDALAYDFFNDKNGAPERLLEYNVVNGTVGFFAVDDGPSDGLVTVYEAIGCVLFSELQIPCVHRFAVFDKKMPALDSDVIFLSHATQPARATRPDPKIQKRSEPAIDNRQRK